MITNQRSTAIAVLEHPALRVRPPDHFVPEHLEGTLLEPPFAG